MYFPTSLCHVHGTWLLLEITESKSPLFSEGRATGKDGNAGTETGTETGTGMGTRSNAQNGSQYF